MYTLRPTTRFRRDVKRCKKRGLNLDLLNEAFDFLTESGGLPESYGAHPLRGEYVNCFDAHIASDWVLIYEVFLKEQFIVLRRTGTHQDVFKGY